MTSMTISTARQTVREALVGAIIASADYNSNDLVAPLAILWPDAERVWVDAVAALRGEFRVITLGEFDPAKDSGPVAWLRIRLAETSKAGESDATVPTVVYLPGVARKNLADAQTLSEDLRPLAGIAVRSAIFAQRNSSDWTPQAFFMNEQHGLGLSVASDNDTKEALVRSVHRLLDTPVLDLRGRNLTSVDFDKAVVDDPPRQVLRWLNQPRDFRAEAEANGTWDGFVSLVKKAYKVDVLKDGELVAGQRLGEREGKWSEVWTRFSESPRAYLGVVDVLRRAKPDGVISLHPDSWPQDNEAEEARANAAVRRIADSAPAEIRSALAKLEAEHADRRGSVWNSLGQAPFAELVGRLAVLAIVTTEVGLGSTVIERAADYTTVGWKVDAAFLAVLAALEAGHPTSPEVTRAAEALYRPWLDASAKGFQAAWTSAPPEMVQTAGVDANEPHGTCAVFVDGLRFDVAADLATALEGRGLAPDLGWGLAGVPTVTSTCKPSVTPVGDLLETGLELTPSTPVGAPANQDSLKKLMVGAGWTFVPGDGVGDPDGRGWTEGGDIDTLGHNVGLKLAHQLPGEVRLLENRVSELLAAGWQRVIVITDHGWLLLPGKMPKHHLPEHLTVKRKGRCARLIADAAVPAGIPVLPWRWDENVRIAVAPGIHAFEEGKVYEHGGISPQESVVPRLVVTKPSAGSSTSTLKVDCSWAGTALSIEVYGAPDGTRVDIRSKPADPMTSMAVKPKELKNGKARLMARDEHEGEAAFVVVIGADETALANKLTQIPGG